MTLGGAGAGAVGGPSPAILGPLIPWGTTETGEPGSPFVPIPPGQLDCVTTARERLYKQFEAPRPNWTALSELIGELFCDVSRQQGQINSLRYVSTASGVQLDEIGELVGRPRNGLPDDDYRRAIVAAANALITSGTVPEILDLVRTLFGDSVSIDYQEFYPASFRLCVFPLAPPDFDLLLQILADTPPAAVAALLCTFDPDEIAGWDTTTGNDAGPPLASWTSTTGPDADDARSRWVYVAKIGP